MTPCDHRIRRWRQGTKTGQWIGSCTCGDQVHQPTKPELAPIAREVLALAGIRERMARFDRPAVRREVWAKVQDWRAKQAGERE